jgi:hypothetical protein
MGKNGFSYPCKSVLSVVHSLLFPEIAEGLRTDDVLWRATRRADTRQIKREYRRDAGSSTATAGYAASRRCRAIKRPISSSARGKEITRNPIGMQRPWKTSVLASGE